MRDRDAVLADLARANLGHAARTKRAMEIARGLLRDPAASFPAAASDDGALEGTYRFFNNDAVDWRRVLEPHCLGTVERLDQAEGDVVVIHDTTEFEFGGEQRGLGRLRSKGNGFFGHFALATDSRRRPFGLLGISTLVRDGPAKERRPAAEVFVDPEKETLRWGQMVGEVRGLLGARRVVHVMDRGADSYELLAQLLDANESFVIRCGFDRVISGSQRLHEHVANTPLVVQREVRLSRRKSHPQPVARKVHPPRRERTAQLELRSASVEIRRPRHVPKSFPAQLQINVVLVQEVNTGDGEDPVQWVLLTNEDIKTPAGVERVVDLYRCRWTIEEYFKSLKSGCSFEKRQLESLDALLRALAILAPLAWRLLRLRSLAEEEADAPATTILSPQEVRVLRHLRRGKLAENPTVSQAFLAIAAVGGHLKQNGRPGWMVLWKGWMRLAESEDISSALETDQW